MAHTPESLAEMFLGTKEVVRTTQKQGEWLIDLFNRFCGEIPKLIYFDTVNVEHVAIRGRHYDFKISRMAMIQKG